MRELERLLSPVSPEAFFRDHWGRKPLHIPGPPDKFAEVYEADAWLRLQNTPELKASVIDPAGRQVEVWIEASQAEAVFLAGMTICADVSLDPKLAPFLQGFRRCFDLPGGGAFARLYVSNHGNGFAVHADKHHVFVMQISGKKCWCFSREPVVPMPMQGMYVDPAGKPIWAVPRDGEPVTDDDGKPVPPPNMDEFEVATLEEGHCLYLPPGTWHVARAVGHSVAVSISPPRATAAEFVTEFLQNVLASRPEWRQDLTALRTKASSSKRKLAKLAPPAVSDALGVRLRELRKLTNEVELRSVLGLWQMAAADGAVTDGEEPASDSGSPRESSRGPAPAAAGTPLIVDPASLVPHRDPTAQGAEDVLARLVKAGALPGMPGSSSGK